jgi:hypothetical protein
MLKAGFAAGHRAAAWLGADWRRHLAMRVLLVPHSAATGYTYLDEAL